MRAAACCRLGSSNKVDDESSLSPLRREHIHADREGRMRGAATASVSYCGSVIVAHGGRVREVINSAQFAHRKVHSERYQQPRCNVQYRRVMGAGVLCAVAMRELVLR